MKNAYSELCEKLEKVKKKFSDIKNCWVCNFDAEFWLFRREPSYFVMYENTKDNIRELKKWLKKYNYDSGYGWQELYWEVVFNDGTRLERWEYDGAEWREYKKTPDIKQPEFFRKVEEKWRYEHTHSVLDIE